MSLAQAPAILPPAVPAPVGVPQPVGMPAPVSARPSTPPPLSRTRTSQVRLALAVRRSVGPVAAFPDVKKGKTSGNSCLRLGVVSPVGSGNLDKHTNTGWNVTVGLKEPISCPCDRWKVFADLGVGYTQQQGDQQPVITAVVFRR